MRNIMLKICYDGTRYRGWQRLPDTDETIQGRLEKTLSRILDEPIEIHGSGRTDAGVHARGQVANFHSCNPMPACDILSNLCRYLPEDIGVYSCEEVETRFHARLNAKQKVYQYRIWNSNLPCVFDRRYVAVFPEELNLEAMRSAARVFLGTHDFGAFCTMRSKKKSTVRSIEAIDISRCGNEIRITVTGNGFLYNMMRILVGTMIEVGRGERDIQTLHQLFDAERKDAGFLAPARGLCLMEVQY